MPNNQHNQPTFVAMSVAMIAATNGNGFWNESQGWVAFKDATHFTATSVLQSKIGKPTVDVTWLTFVNGKLADTQAPVGQRPEPVRLVIQVRGGVVASVHSDAPIKFDVVVRDMDNIAKGDADPCVDPEIMALITPDHAIY